MNGDTEALDADAAKYRLPDLNRGPVPRVNVPIKLIIGKVRKGLWYRNWDGGQISEDDITRGWVSVPYHSIIRVYRGQDPKPGHPHKYIFQLRFFPC